MWTHASPGSGPSARRSRRGVTLLEAAIVLVVLAIVMTVGLPALRPSETERLRAAADLLVSDLRLAQGLAVRDASNFTLTPTSDGWKIEHTGSGPSPVLPSPPLGGTGSGYEISISTVVGRQVALTARLADSGTAATAVTFTPTGGTTATESLVFWLAVGAGDEARCLPVGVSQVTGRAAVGEPQVGAPPPVGESTPLLSLDIRLL